MENKLSMTNYTIISPVRNEEEFIEKTLKSVVNQTLKPLEWIIIDDGSTDKTAEIVNNYVKKYDWIKMINQQDRGFYYPGKGVVDTFYKGFDNISNNNWDFIVKLDCDLSFQEDYFEKVLHEFELNPKLGIASGLTFIPSNGGMVSEKVQDDHPVGPSKVYRKECFKDIDGLKPISGWDLADLLSAQMKGWETKCFDNFKINHYRKTGSRRSDFTSGMFLWGRFHYRYGYGLFYTFLKSIYRLAEKPVIIGGISIFLGYLYAFVKQEDRIFDKEMRKFLRKKQRVYLKQKINKLFSK